MPKSREDESQTAAGKDDQARFLPTRRSLLSRLRREGDDESWREFFDTYWKLIYRAATQAGLSGADAEDVVQETIITVSRGIRDFRYNPGQGSFKGWLLNTTRWRVIDHLRRNQKQALLTPLTDDNRETSLVERLPNTVGDSLDKMWEEDWQRNLLDAAMHRVKSKVNPKHFQIFELAAIKGWPPAKVADTLDVGRAQVHLIKHRVAQLVRKEVRRLEKEGV